MQNIEEQENDKIKNIKKEFSIFDKIGDSFSYLDSAATTQKPKIVIEGINYFYNNINANVHRGVHTLSQKATQAVEDVRDKVKNFISVDNKQEIIFTKGTTESINLLSNILSGYLKKDDEIILSEAEHHSNIVPWQILAEKTGAKIKIVPIKENGEINFEYYKNILSDKTKIVSISHISNVLGYINPIKEMALEAHKKGALFICDGAQAVGHIPVDVNDLGVDFYAFSAHKMYGPSGVGVLWGKKDILQNTPPYQGGGDMIKSVSFEKTTYAPLPFKYEAGTPNMEGIYGLGKAIDFLNNLGMKNIEKHDREMSRYAYDKMKSLDDIKIYGEKNRIGVLSFNIKNIHNSDLGVLLDKQNVAIRTGHHCAEPLMKKLNVDGTARASFGIYTQKEDIDRLFKATEKAVKILKD